MILRLYSDPDNRTTLDARTLIANPEGLEEHSGRGEMKMAWDEVDEIAGTPDHTFISFQERPSIVIPRARISKGDYAGFVQGSQDYVRAAEQAGTEDGNGRAS